jgi:hypothetical protein
VQPVIPHIIGDPLVFCAWLKDIRRIKVVEIPVNAHPQKDGGGPALPRFRVELPERRHPINLEPEFIVVIVIAELEKWRIRMVAF